MEELVEGPSCVSDMSSACTISYDGRGKEVTSINNRSKKRKESTLLSVSWADEIIGVGQFFVGGAREFRRCLQQYSIERGFNYNFDINNSHTVTAFCIERTAQQCEWFIHAKLDRATNGFYIHKYLEEHNCEPICGKEDKNRISKALVGDLIKQKLKVNPHLSANEIQAIIRDDYGLELSYNKCWQALQYSKESIVGGSHETYKQLEAYIEAAMITNPGSHIVMNKFPDDENKDMSRFNRLFVSFDACIKGVKHCRPLLFIHGSFLSGFYKGMLLSATAKDGDGGLFPVAYGVVDAENKDNWLWFLQHLCIAIGDHHVDFFSDRHAGLLAALPIAFPESKNFFCVQHLIDNRKTKFCRSGVLTGKKKKICYLFRQCANAITTEYFDKKFKCLEEEGTVIVTNFLKDLPLEK